MKPDKLKKLFKAKRIIALTLSAAMLVTSVPQTAFAAEAEPEVVETQVDETQETQTNAEETVTVVETTAEADAQQEEEQTAQSSSSLEVTESETTKAQTEAEESKAETTVAETEIATADAGQEEIETIAEENAEGEKPAAEIKFDFDQTDNELGGFKRKQNADSNAQIFTRKYTRNNLFGGVVNDVKDAIQIIIDNEDKTTSLSSQITYKYQKKAADGNWADVEETVPTDAGSYRLVVSVAETELCTAAEDYIYLEVEPLELTLKLEVEEQDEQGESKTRSLLEADPGSSIADFIKKVEADYTFSSDKVSDSDKKYYKSIASLSVNIYERDSEGKLPAETTKDTTFDSSKDYAVVFGVTFSDAAVSANCKVKADDYYVISFEELVTPEVSVDRKDANKGQDIVKTYDGNALDLNKIVEEYIDVTTLKVTKEGENGKRETILDKDSNVTGVVTPAWYTRERVEGSSEDIEVDKDTQYAAEKNGATYIYSRMTDDKKESMNPTEVGEYYLVYKYPGEKGRYKEAYSEPICVTLEPAALTLKPADLTLTTGMNKDGVKKTLAGAAYTLLKEDGSEYTDAPKTFFGTAYGNDGTTQYFTPEFKLEARVKWDQQYIDGLGQHEADAEWTEWKDWAETVESVQEETQSGKDPVIQDKTSDGRVIEYRVISTGKKVVYKADGSVYEISDKKASIADTTTNSAEKNYKVKADADTLEKNVGKVTINAAAATEIKVDDIVKSFTDANKGTGDLDAPAYKIYDGDPLFATRADYKKAAVTAGGTAVEATDKSITYTWQELRNYQLYEDYLSASSVEKETNGKTEKENAKIELEKDSKYTWNSNWVSDDETENSVYIAPYNAALYRLKITYRDETNKNQPAEKYVYFEIKKQAVITVAGKQYEEYGKSVYNADEANKRNYALYLLADNNEAAFNPETAELIIWDYNAVDTVKWQTQIQNGDTWADVSSGVFLKGNSYRRYAYFDEFISVDNDEGIVTLAGIPVRNKNGRLLYWSNFTNVKSYDSEKADWTYYSIPNDVLFDKSDVAITVNESVMPKDTVYKGDSVTTGIDVKSLLTLKDKETNADTGIAVTADPSDPDIAKSVYVYWVWENNEGDDVIEYNVPFNNARYGGEYRLHASFAGNDTYKAFDKDLVIDEKEYKFEIKPLEINIAPKLNEDVPAGERVEDLWDREQIEVTPVKEANPIPENDKWLFEYQPEDTAVRYDVEGREYYYSGYGILSSDDNNFDIQFYDEDGKRISDDSTYLRYDKEYTAKFNEISEDGLFWQYKKSYKINCKAVAQKIVSRGETDVRGTDIAVHVTTVKETGKNNTYTIVPQEAVPFIYDNYDGNIYNCNNYVNVDNEHPSVDKNYIGLTIPVPNEFLEYKGWKYDSYIGRYAYTYDSSDTFESIYKNSIFAAGGYCYSEGIKNTLVDTDVSKPVIRVLFPVEVEKDADGKDKVKAISPFNITWENGYTETFTIDVTNAVLESNLKKAVAPKTLAFNGVQTKMAVGDTQQLDLKIAKANLGDVIKINYRVIEDSSEGASKVSIDPETGVVTALAAGKKAVNIEAYPVRLSDDGTTYEEITGKGVKIAKTKITVTEVTAPAIKKITVNGQVPTIQYARVENGYRREIYVVAVNDKTELKTWTDKKNNQFEATIAKMEKNGQWKEAGFACEPIYLKAVDEYKDYYDAKSKLVSYTIDAPDLKANQEYVVYVRNVSAPRTLADGSAVAFSAAGTMKNFVTTKSQVVKLIPWFAVENDSWVKEDGTIDESYNTPTAKNPVVYYTNQKGEIQDGSTYFKDGRFYSDPDNRYRNKKYREYTVDFLTAKSIQLMVDGEFLEKPSNPAADEDDTIYKTLPVKKDKEFLENYVDPKVTYAVFDESLIENGDIEDYVKFENGKVTVTNQSKYATIANNGKLTLKSVAKDGEAVVWIYAIADNGVMNYDSNQYYCTPVKLHITAKPDSVTAKKAKLKVGDEVRLATLLEYKAGGKKLPDHRSTKIEITSEQIESAKAAGIELWQAQDGDRTANGEICVEGEWVLKVIKDGSCNLQIKDMGVGEAGQDVTIPLTAAVLDPVKSLKTAYVDDQHITINFGHTGNPEAFDIEVKDAAQRVIYKRLVWNDNTGIYENNGGDGIWYNVWDTKAFVRASAPNYQQEKQRAIMSNWFGEGKLAYFEKTKIYAYTIESDKLLRLSTYTITVTPVVGAEKALKPASTKAKTTNVPASYENMNIKNPTYANTYYGGANISCNTGLRDYGGNNSLSDYPYLVAGNTYTLKFEDEEFAKDRITDTLTWKSSNTKVASIKAYAGTYTAALKAQQQGTTVITVTSKVTKKIVARYLIAVMSVGNGNAYLGDYEYSNGHDGFYDDVVFRYDPFYNGKLEVLTLSNPVVVDEQYLYGKEVEDGYISGTGQDATWVQFTAPAFGQYSFDITPEGRDYTIYTDRNLDVNLDDIMKVPYSSKGVVLEAGQKIYFRICGTFNLSVSKFTDFAKLTTANDSEENALQVAKASYIKFTAPEDNVYTFKTVAENKKDADSSETVRIYEENNNSEYSSSVSKGMRKGETVLLDISGKCWLYVEPRITSDVKAVQITEPAVVTFEKPDKTTEYPFEKWVKFTAPDSTYYAFDVEQDAKLKWLEPKYYSLLGADILADGDDVTSEFNQLNEVANGADVKGKGIYIQAGETVLIKFTVNSETQYANSFTGDTKELGITVKVTSAQVAQLTSEYEIAENTVAVFAFQISEGTNKYTFAVESEEPGKDTAPQIQKYRGSDYNAITVNNNTITVNDDKTTNIEEGVKAGDTIYIQVRNESKKYKATIKVTSPKIETLKANETLNITLVDGFEGWYVFTAEKAGLYQFDYDTIKNDSSPSHTLQPYRYDKVFGGYVETLVNGARKSLKAGESIVFKVETGENDADGNETKATFAVKEIPVTPIKVGDTTVELTAKDEVKKYVFTYADTADTYHIQWKPDEDTTGSATAKLSPVEEADGSNISGETSITESPAYITVEQTSKNPVKGTLTITADKTSIETLKLGEAKEVTLAKEDDEKSYRFIPSDSILGYKLEVTNTTAPDASIDKRINISGYASASLKAGETRVFVWNGENEKNITIKAEADNVSAKITVTKCEAEDLGEGKTLDSVTSATSAWYQYTIPASGRYVLTEDTSVTWYKKNSYNTKYGVSSADYFKTGDTLYVLVKGNSTESVKVTVAQPTLVNPEFVELDKDVKIELTKDEKVKYYAFKATESARYSITGNVSVIGYLSKAGSWSNNELDKDESILLSVRYDTIINVTKGSDVKEIKSGETLDITDLKNGVVAVYKFTAYKDGIYEFKSTSKDSTITVNADEKDKFGSIKNVGYYRAYMLTAGQQVTITVTNDDKSEAQKASFKISVSELKPEAFTTTEDKAELKVPAYDVKWFEYTTPKAGDYTFGANHKVKVGDTESTAEDKLDIYVYTYNKNGDKLYTYEPQPEGNKYLDAGKKVIFAISNTGKDETAYSFTAKVKEYATSLNFTGDEERTITFTPEKTGTYTITPNCLDEGIFQIKGDNLLNKNWQSFYSDDNYTSVISTAILRKGEAVTFKVRKVSEGKHSVAYSIEADKTVNAEDIGLAYTVAADDKAEDITEKTIVALTADKEGDYIVEATEGITVSVVESDKTFENPSGNKDVVRTLGTGERVYVVINRIDAEIAKKGFTVKLSRFEELGSEQKGEISYPETKLYKLTVKDGEAYELRNIAPKAADGTLLDSATVQYYLNNEYVTELGSDMTVEAEPDAKEKTIYLKVSSGENGDITTLAKYNYILKAVKYEDLTTTTPANGTVDTDDAKYYRYIYTDTDKGEYIIVKGTEEKATVEYKMKYADGSSDSSFRNFSSDTVKNQRTYYFKITPSNPVTEDANKKYKLTVSKNEPKPFVDGVAKGTIKKGEEVTYEYVVTKGGDYVYEFSYEDGLTVTPPDGNRPVTRAAGAGDILDNWHLNKGDIIKITVSAKDVAEDKEYAYEFSIKQIEYTELTAGTKVTPKLPAGKYAYYKYTRKTDEESYVFETTGSVDVRYRGKYYNEVWHNVNVGNDLFSTTIYNNLNDNTTDTVYFRVANTGTEEAEYTLNVNTYKDFGTEQSGKLAKGETAYFEYDVKVSGPYVLNYKKGTAQVTVNNITLNTVGEKEQYLYSGKATIKIANPTDAEVEYDFSIAPPAYTSLKAGEAVKDKEVDNVTRDYYEFTAAVGQQYVLTIDGIDKVTILSRSSGISPNSIATYGTSADYRIVIPDNGEKRNATVNFSVTGGSPDKAKYTVTVKPYETLTLGTAVTGTFKAGASNRAYYKITGKGEYVEEYMADNTVVYSEPVSLSPDSEEDETVYFELERPSEAAADADVAYSFIIKDYTPLTADKEVSEKLKKGTYAWYKFTNEGTNYQQYAIETAGGLEVSYNYYGSWNSIYSDFGQFNLNPNTTVYVKVYNNTETEEADYKLTIRTYKEVKLGEAMTGEIAKDGKRDLYKFTAENAGAYTLTKDDATTANVSGGFYFSNSNTTTTLLGKNSTTYIVVAHGYNDGDAASKYNLTLTAAEAKLISEGAEESVSFTADAADRKCYKFTATTAGEYVIEYNGNSNVQYAATLSYGLYST